MEKTMTIQKRITRLERAIETLLFLQEERERNAEEGFLRLFAPNRRGSKK